MYHEEFERVEVMKDGENKSWRYCNVHYISRQSVRNSCETVLSYVLCTADNDQVQRWKNVSCADK